MVFQTESRGVDIKEEPEVFYNKKNSALNELWAECLYWK